MVYAPCMAQSTNDDNVIPLESAVVKQCRTMLKRRGAFNMKTQGGGVADLLCCYRGVWISAEVKRPGGAHPLSPRQRVHLERVRNAGGVGIVVRAASTLEGVLDALDVGIDDLRDVQHAIARANRAPLS